MVENIKDGLIRGVLKIIGRIKGHLFHFSPVRITGRLFHREPCVCASLSFVYTRETDNGKEIWFNDFFRVLWDNGEVALWDEEDKE